MDLLAIGRPLVLVFRNLTVFSKDGGLSKRLLVAKDITNGDTDSGEFVMFWFCRSGMFEPHKGEIFV